MKLILAASTLTWTLRCWALSSHTTVRYLLVSPPSLAQLHTVQIVISTGRSDWEREVTETTGSLAAYMLQVSTSSILNTPKPASPPSVGKSSSPSTGLFNPSQSTRISILNGSHNTLSHEDDHETVLIFPDFKVASEVRRSMQGAQDLWDSSVAPGISRSGAFLEKSTLRTWILPYACVILLCQSHVFHFHFHFAY